MTAPQPVAHAEPAPLTQREKLLAFSGVLLVLFLSSLNLTVVGTAMPRVISELGGFSLYAWAFTAYSLTTTISIPIVGTLSDTYGRRPLMLFGIAVFAVGAVLIGLAQSMEQLIIFRAVQGIGGGTLMAMAFTAIADIFTPLERGRYQGYTGAVWGVSSVVGPVVGGFLTDHLGWRSVFFVNLPFALLAAYFIARFLRMKPLPGASRHFDAVGALLLAATVVPLMLVFSWGGGTYAWTSPRILGLAALSVVLGVVYGFWQARQENPILSLKMFRDRTFTVAAICGFMVSAGMYAAILYLPLYMQGVKGSSASGSGAVLTPLMLGLIAASTLAGQWVSRNGRYKWLIAGGSVVTLLALFLTSRLRLESQVWEATALMVLMGLGLGPVNSLLTLAVQNAVPRTILGMATSASQFFRNIGGTLAVSLFGAVVNAHLAAQLGQQLPAAARTLPAPLQAAVNSPQLLSSPEASAQVQGALVKLGHPELFAGIVGALRRVMVGAIDNVFLISAALMVVAVVAAFVLPDLSLQGRQTSGTRAGQDQGSKAQAAD
ncbi:MDR family MFS transporter [Deinococcus sonorensis]|uniref:MDR family MFS transporter n=2 Tax=Deinococcus sonorensis TaxID=309891 RepID=A0AAU7U9E6_9DEIO